MSIAWSMRESRTRDREEKSGPECSEPLRETDALCCWLARLPVENNRPRPVVPGVVADSAVNGVVVVGQEQLVAAAFATLTAGGFLGCPVVDAFGVYIDQLDLLDLVLFLCKLFRARQRHPPCMQCTHHTTTIPLCVY
jgi:hypothetical protein